MPLNYRKLEFWLTLFWGVSAVGAWSINGVQAALAEHALSTKALFVWVAAAMAGLAIGLTLGFALAPLRARQLRSNPAMAEWDLANSQLTSGIAFLGMATSPIHSLTVGAWDWAWLVMTSLLGAMIVGLALVVRGERRPQPMPPYLLPPSPMQPPWVPAPGMPPPGAPRRPGV